MAMTKTSDLSNSVVTSYEKAYYLIAAQDPGIWAQFVQWQPPISAGNGGSSYDYPTFGELDPVEDALTEDADVTPDSITDGNVTITPTEYGKTVARTKKAELQSRVNLATIMGEQVSRNRIKSIDRILRRGACGRGSSMPTNTIPISGATMLGLSGASNTISWDFLQELNMHAESIGLEPMDGTNFVAVIHPLLEYDLKKLTEFKTVGYYQAKDNIYKGEVGMLGNIRFIKSRMGRVHLGAGALVSSGANTTLNGAVNKGATSFVVASGSNIAAGDYLTIGTQETESVNPANNLEQVFVTGVNSTTITIRANGVGGSFGLRFDHATGEVVRETYNVASIPIIGKNSLIGVYASETGKYGSPKLKTGLDTLDRFTYLGWYWYGGLGVVQKNLILGRVALSKWMMGYN